jgi:hypothetical protein
MRISRFGRKGKSPHIPPCGHTMLKGIKNKFWEDLTLHAFLKLHLSMKGGQQKLKTSDYII